MNEIQRITAAYRDARARGEALALATVVAVRGSAYRRPGARMLIGADGRNTGAVSGGCLERDVMRQASRVLGGDAPILRLYDSTDEDLDEGFALGCNGAVLVLVEAAGAELGAQFDFFADCMERRRRGVLATVFATGGHRGAHIGARLMLTAAGSAGCSGIPDAALRARLEAAAGEALQARRSAVLRIEHEGHAVEVFVEVLEPPLQVVVFGAGHDVPPLVQFGKALGWNLAVVSAAGGYGVRQRFAAADALFVGSAEAACTALQVDDDSVVLLMSHNYPQDLRALRALLPLRPRYIGLLGPRRRAERLLEAAAEDGIDAELRARIFGPVGLDIGAETPEEVALAIVAEIRAATLGRDGRQSRLRPMPLHLATATERWQPPAEARPQGDVVCGLGAG